MDEFIRKIENDLNAIVDSQVLETLLLSPPLSMSLAACKNARQWAFGKL